MPNFPLKLLLHFINFFILLDIWIRIYILVKCPTRCATLRIFSFRKETREVRGISRSIPRYCSKRDGDVIKRNVAQLSAGQWNERLAGILSVEIASVVQVTCVPCEGSSNALPLVSLVYERHVHPINSEPNYAPSKTLLHLFHPPAIVGVGESAV